MSKTSLEHKAQAPSRVSVLIITCSTSRFKEAQQGRRVDDPSGDFVANALIQSGHTIFGRRLVSDDKKALRRELDKALAAKDLDSVIICGGTGISPRDLTIEVVKKYLEKDLPGFGELFRRIGYDRIGSPAILSRALAGVAKGKVIFCLPGSKEAVETAMTKIIIPEISHIIKHIRE